MAGRKIVYWLTTTVEARLDPALLNSSDKVFTILAIITH